MKNLFKKAGILSIAVFMLCGALNAGEIALIVKQDGRKVYLDTSEFKVKPSAGDKFRIASWGEEIINPKTGKKLGRELKGQIEGTIEQTEALYSVGLLQQDNPVLSQEAEVFITAAQPAPAPQPQAQNGLKVLTPLLQTKPIEGKAIAAAAGDIDGDGAAEVVFAFEKDNTIKSFKPQSGELKQTAEFALNPLKKIISLDAADLKANGMAQLFASVYDSGAQKFYTLVFEQQGQTFTQTDTIKGLVKGITQEGKRVLYVQDSGLGNAFGTPAPLVYAQGKFADGEPLKAYKFGSIFGFNLFDFKGEGVQNVIYTTSSGVLRVQFEKKGSFIESPSSGPDFGTTPLRVKINGKARRFYTPLAVFKNAQGTYCAALEHTAKMGLLADMFGSYSAAKIYLLQWNQSSLLPVAYADIPGVSSDILQADFGFGAQSIAVPFYTTAGQTSVLFFSLSAV